MSKLMVRGASHCCHAVLLKRFHDSLAVVIIWVYSQVPYPEASFYDFHSWDVCSEWIALLIHMMWPFNLCYSNICVLFLNLVLQPLNQGG